jgi:membrane fusion protein (multidrug efflux system)
MMAEAKSPSSSPDPGQDVSMDLSPLRSAGALRRTDTQKRRRKILIVATVLVVLVAGFLLWRYLSSYESTDDAQADVHLYPVSSRVSGYVIRVNVDDNQWVKAGAVLVEIDPKDYEVAVAQAQANLASAEATAKSLNITVPITSTTTRRSCPDASRGSQRHQSPGRSSTLQTARRQTRSRCAGLRSSPRHCKV